MLKYAETLITFTEVPDEITLCLNITNCPCHCQDCFEPWLANDYGTPINIVSLCKLIDANPHISCLCFMGGDRDHDQIRLLSIAIKNKYPKLKTAMYSGSKEFDKTLASVLDYYKVGPYIPSAGPLNKKTTNQKFYKKNNKDWIDITYRFQIEKK